MMQSTIETELMVEIIIVYSNISVSLWDHNLCSKVKNRKKTGGKDHTPVWKGKRYIKKTAHHDSC